MNRKSQFECDADVEQHFAVLAALSRKPVPPADLWERMEQSRQVAPPERAAQPKLATTPEKFLYEQPSVLRQQPLYPLNDMREVVIAPVKRRKRVITQRISLAPRTLVGLVQRASNRKRKQK